MHISEVPTPVNPEVSIIVPVYNVEKYLRECLDSIMAQTFKDWECVVVDDGSTDGSGAICDEYAKIDSRFKVFHTQNGGLSAARNRGITESHGNFIAFCDSDDWLDPEMIDVMHRRISEYDADIVQIGYWKEYDGYNKIKRPVKDVVVYNREEALKELVNGKRIPSYVWMKMFRHSIIGPDFPVKKVFEDIYSDFIWFNKAQKVVCDPRPLYHYRMRKGSIVHDRSSSFRLDYIKATCYRANEVYKLGINNFNALDRDLEIVKACVRGAKLIARNESDENKRMIVIRDISDRLRESGNPGMKLMGLKLWFRRKLLATRPESFSRLMRIVGKADLHSHYRLRGLYD